MGIGAVYPCLATRDHGGKDEVCQGKLVSYGGKVASAVGRRAPIMTADLDVMRRPQPRRNPIRLILASKTKEHFGENRTHESDPISIKQVVNCGFFRRIGFAE